MDASTRNPLTTTEIIRSAEGFRELRSEWGDLLKASDRDCLFLTWEWMHTWWLHLSGNRSLHIIAVREDGLLIGMAPLALCPPQFGRMMPFRTLEFLGSGCVGSDYLSFVLRSGHEESAMREIGRCLTGSGHMLELVRVEKGALAMRDMALQLGESGWKCVSRTTAYCPYATLQGHSWESFLETCSRSHRKNVARKFNRLDKDHSVEFSLVMTDGERQAALQLLVRLNVLRWSKRGESSAFDSRELVEFHQDFSKISLDRGWLRLYTLKLDGDGAAVIYLYKYNDVFYYYQTAFNADYEKYSVGGIILALAIKEAISEDAVEFDFLHDDEAYKYLWTRKRRELIRMECYPPRLAGSVNQQIMQVRSGIKHVVRRLAGGGEQL